MTHDQPLRRVHIDRIVLRGRPLAPGDELVLRSSLRGALRHPDGPSLRAAGDDVSRLGSQAAAAIRDAVDREAAS